MTAVCRVFQAIDALEQTLLQSPAQQVRFLHQVHPSALLALLGRTLLRLHRVVLHALRVVSACWQLLHHLAPVPAHLGLSPPWAVAQLQRARLVPQENIVSSAAPAPQATGHVLQALTPSKARAWLRVAFPVRPGDIALPVLPRFQDRVFVHLEHTPRRARV